MKKAGAIIALIAGIFSIFASGVTLVFGGIGSALEAEKADVVVGLGWGGVLFSFIVIVLGAISFSAQKKIVGILLILSSLAGIVFGGTLVAVFMVLSLVAGLLVTFGTQANA